MMNKFSKIGLIFALLSGCAFAQVYYGQNGDCILGAQQTITQGLASVGVTPSGSSTAAPGSGVMGSFPKCQVTVYSAGTTTLAPLFGNSTGSQVLANPFIANSDGTWAFWVGSGCYDVTLTSSSFVTLPTSRTYNDYCIAGGDLTGVTLTVGGIILPASPVYWSFVPSLQSACQTAMGLSQLCGSPDGNWYASNTGGTFYQVITTNQPVVTTPTINTSVGCGTGLKITELASCTTAGTPSASCDTTLTWCGTAFADTNYVALCSIGNDASAAFLPVIDHVVKATGTITVTIFNTVSSGAAHGDIVCMGWHP